MRIALGALSFAISLQAAGQARGQVVGDRDRLGLEDQRIHSLILGYWHTIVTPPMAARSEAPGGRGGRGASAR